MVRPLLREANGNDLQFEGPPANLDEKQVINHGKWFEPLCLQ